MRLFLLRHPRPDVAPGLCYGSSDVAPLTRDTARVHAQLRAAGLPGALPVYASPLRRCAELARALAGATVTFDARLAEMDFGDWELRSWDSIGRSAVDAWNADLLHYQPGAGESVLQVTQRVAAFSASIEQSGQPAALLICHAGTIRLLKALHSGVSLRTAALQAASTPHQIGYGEMLVLET